MKHDDELAGLSQFYKALGDETRLHILALLNYGELCVCDIMEVLSLPQSTASRHLAYLKYSGWVTGRRKGKWMYYALHTDGVDADRTIKKAILSHLNQTESCANSFKKLEKYMKTKKTKMC